MQVIYYINKEKEIEISQNPEKVWDLFSGSKLLPYKLDDSISEANVENIICY